MNKSTVWWEAALVGLAAGIVGFIMVKFIIFASWSDAIIGDHIVKCSHCQKVINPCASPLLIELLKKMQESCDCSKGA